ncbi:MAG: TonB-dependent receptor [Planctomycetota bacterium]|nr:TonB-dependent receptor [Planctomycetota bacterium]
MILIPLLVAGQDPIPADDAERIRLGEIIISARPLDVDESSRDGLQLFDRQHLSPVALRTLADVLDQVPGIHLQKTAHGQFSPYLRGMTGFRTLVLVDGVRLNNAIYRSGPNQYLGLVDPLALAGTEVIFGPGSVLYGSDAAGGTILLEGHSVEPSSREQDQTLVTQRFASAEDSSVSRIDRIIIREKTAIRFGASFKDHGDYVAGRTEGLQLNTGYREWSGDLSLTHEIHDDLDLVIGIQHHRQPDVPRTHSTIYGSQWNGLTHGSDLKRDIDGERELMYSRFIWRHDDGSQSQWSLSRHRISEEEDRVRASGLRKVQGLSDETLGITYHWNGESPWGEIRSGVEFYRDRVDSYRSEYALDGSLSSVATRGAVADDSRYDRFGIYLQDTIPLDDSTRLVIGGRWASAEVKAAVVDPDPLDSEVIGSIEDRWSAVVGTAHAVHQYSDRLQLHGGLSQAFRAPNLSDLTRFDIAAGGETEIPTPGLDPEHYLSAEFGFDYSREEWAIEGVLWHSWLDSLVVRFPTGDLDPEGNEIVTKENAGAGSASGFDLRMKRDFTEQWRGHFSCSWITGSVETPVAPGIQQVQPLSRLAPAMVRIALRYLPTDDVTLEGAITIAGKQHRLSLRDLADVQRIPPGGTPGYAVVDFQGRWQATSRTHLFVGLTNLGDVDYRLHGSGSNEAGVSIVTGMETRF